MHTVTGIDLPEPWKVLNELYKLPSVTQAGQIGPFGTGTGWGIGIAS